MASPARSANIAPAFRGYNALFNQQYSSATPLWNQLAMRTDSSGESETYGWMAELPGVREWKGSRVRHTVKLNDYRIVNKKWELTIDIPEEDVDRDKLGLYNARASQMGASAEMKTDQLVLDALVDGFVDTGYDSAAFYSASHTWKGGTWANYYNYSLDASNFALVKQKHMELLGHFGTKDESPLNTNPQFRLIVGPALEATARSIIKMERVNGGDSNVNLNAADLLVLPYLRNGVGKNKNVNAANYWFLEVTNTPGGLMPFINQVEIPWRTREFTSGQEWVVFDQGRYVWGVDSRSNVGYGLWQLIIGCDGG